MQTKMGCMWEAEGIFLGRLDQSDEVIVRTPQSIETKECEFVSVPWNPHPVGVQGCQGDLSRAEVRASF